MVGSLDQVAQKRVCFGHQSVGANLMNALSALGGRRLAVVESRDPEIFRRPVLAHFRVGQNHDPLSKCRAFAQVIDSGVGERVDIAFFKFCYVDIGAQTDVNQLFHAYQGVMDSLRKRYPKVMFFHLTVPLRRINTGLLGWVREKIGGFDRVREDQIRRHAYNELLRGAYGRSGRLFDLAAEEAMFPNGRQSSFHCQGRAVPNLVSEYTNDGGHLTPQAAERIAGRLLVCLSAAG